MAIRPEAAKLIQDWSAHYYREMHLIDRIESLLFTTEEEEAFTKMVSEHPHMVRTTKKWSREEFVAKVNEIYLEGKQKSSPTDCECECHYFDGFVHVEESISSGSKPCCDKPGIKKGRGIPL